MLVYIDLLCLSVKRMLCCRSKLEALELAAVAAANRLKGSLDCKLGEESLQQHEVPKASPVGSLTGDDNCIMVT